MYWSTGYLATVIEYVRAVSLVLLLGCFRGWDAAEGQVHWRTSLQKSPSQLLPTWHPLWNCKWDKLQFWPILKALKTQFISKRLERNFRKEKKSAISVFNFCSLFFYFYIIICLCLSLCSITHVCLVFFGDSAWTWGSALRSMTWHFGLIMKLPPRREIFSLSLM